MRGKVCLAQHEGQIFIVIPAMTPRQVRVVQESFKLLAPNASEAARMFYENLFRLAPEIRSLFPDDITPQKHKFFQMLATVVKSLGNISNISQHIADLGRRHASYDVRERHYMLVGQVLLSTLRNILGPQYTDEIHDAWAAAYSMMSRMMLESAATPYTSGNFYGSIIGDVVTSQYGVSEGMASPKAKPRPTVVPDNPVRKNHLF